jgi:hypothetical protein
MTLTSDSNEAAESRDEFLKRTLELRKIIAQLLGLGIGTVTAVFDGATPGEGVSENTYLKVRKHAAVAGCKITDIPLEDIVFPKVKYEVDRSQDATVFLRDMLGDYEYKTLLENFGGTRLYVPVSPHNTNLVRYLSRRSVALLCANLGGDYLKIPIDREFFAVEYYEKGASCADIAVALRMTESGVQRMVSRMRKAGKVR